VLNKVQKFGQILARIGDWLSKFGKKTEAAKGLGDLIEAQTHATKLDKFAEWLAVDILGREGCGCPARRNRLNTLWPFSKPKLIITIPEYNDRGGLWGMLHSLVSEIQRYQLEQYVEIMVVTQTPTLLAPERHVTGFGTPEQKEHQPIGPTVVAGHEPLKGMCNTFTARGVKVHYKEFAQPIGTSPAKRACVRFAAQEKAEWVWICDSHLHFVPGSIHRFYKWVCKTKNRNSKHLYHCPLLLDEGKSAFTGMETRKPNKLALIGGDNLWGQFRTEAKLLSEDSKPEEIQAHGGFFFATRVDIALATFGHDLFRGFGDPETILHEMRRAAGFKVYCLPAKIVACWHRFLKVRHNDYRSPWTDALRNHVIGVLMLRVHLMKEAVSAGFDEPFEWLLASWVDAFPERKEQIYATGIKAAEEYAAWKADVEQMQEKAKQQKAEQQAAKACKITEENLEQRFQRLANTPSDINEHLPKLKELASKCKSVCEFGTRDGVSTTALLAGKPAKVVTYDTNPSVINEALRRLKPEGTELFYKAGPQFNTATMPQIESCEMLLIDSLNTQEHVRNELTRHSESVSRWIVLHDCSPPFANMDEGGGPGKGVLAGIADWRQTPDGKRFKLAYENKANHGLQVWERTERPNGN